MPKGMKLNDHEILDMHELLDGLVENNLSTEQRERLEEWLTHSDEARRQYVAYLDMSASLTHYAEERVSDETPEVAEFSLGKKLVQFITPWIPLAALVLFGLYVYFGYQTQDSLVPIKKFVEADMAPDIPGYGLGEEETVAVLTRGVGLSWDRTTNFRPLVGESLPASSLRIAQGIAQLELVDGATLILEGPIEYELVHGNAGLLKRGKLRAHVPKVAVGFTVGLPRGDVIDLGTDFGIEVHEDQSAELYVYRGRVRYQGLDLAGNHVSEDLVSNQAIYLSADGVPAPLDMPTSSYLGTKDLANRSLEQSQHRRSEWETFSRKLFSKPSTLLYYGFENHAKWDRVLKDETNRNDGAGNGAVIGCNWAQGRWPGKGALQFSRANDRVCLNLPGELSSLTMAAWVKLDGLSTPVYPLIFTRPFQKGSLGWSVNREGKLVLQVRVDGNRVVNYHSAVALPKEKFGRWVHLATSYDSSNKWVSHYVNGRSFSREKIVIPQPLSLKKGLLGYSQDFPPYPKGIALHGSIDEFAIFDSAWDEDKVRELYEIGTPYESSNLLLPAYP
jgi:hypothetical protein